MLGFRDYVIDKYVEKIQNNGYTAVVYSQDTPTPNPTRSLTGIFSPGTFFQSIMKKFQTTCVVFGFIGVKKIN